MGVRKNVTDQGYLLGLIEKLHEALHFFDDDRCYDCAGKVDELITAIREHQK